MRESLFKLLELQEIDKEIDVLRQSQNDFPSEIEQLQNELKIARDHLDTKQKQSEELEKNRRTLERDIEAVNQDLQKHQERLNEITTNREYDAVQHEIEALTIRKNEQESLILETIESVENITSKLEGDREYFKELEKERNERIEELTAKLNSVETHVKGWEKKRSAIEPNVERRPLNQYNRIRRVVKGGVAVVAVLKNSCGGCFRQLAPQRMVEARRGDTLMRCENCGRILVWVESEDHSA
ncbi:MAG: zinc ribbon domain-containing protein [Candidatus Latescibacterota bacterium]